MGTHNPNTSSQGGCARLPAPREAPADTEIVSMISLCPHMDGNALQTVQVGPLPEMAVPAEAACPCSLRSRRPAPVNLKGLGQPAKEALLIATYELRLELALGRIYEAHPRLARFAREAIRLGDRLGLLAMRQLQPNERLPL